VRFGGRFCHLSYTSRSQSGTPIRFFSRFFRFFAPDYTNRCLFAMTETLLSTAPAAIPLTVNGHTFCMVSVQGGTFTMGTKKDDPDNYGDEHPDHDVRVPNFSLGQFPVTQALWKAVMDGENPSFFKGDTRPVEQVSWEDIDKNFLPELNKKLPGWNFRLPTEAEWEYAARSPTLGEGRGGALYAGSNRLEAVGWWAGNSHGETKPVGLKLPNALGLFDMSGNVWEWCEDDWHGDYNGAPTDGRAWVDNPRGSSRVLRGGSWDSDSGYCRVAYRDYGLPGFRGDTVGFRLAASPSSSVAGQAGR
jgi:sulfatase modifying factor 1